MSTIYSVRNTKMPNLGEGDCSERPSHRIEDTFVNEICEIVIKTLRVDYNERRLIRPLLISSISEKINSHHKDNLGLLQQFEAYVLDKSVELLREEFNLVSEINYSNATHAKLVDIVEELKGKIPATQQSKSTFNGDLADKIMSTADKISARNNGDVECVSIELPKFKCIKEVWALKIKSILFDSDLAAHAGRETDGSATFVPEEEGYAPIKLSAEFIRKHNPVAGGYYVVYKDGYESFSPAEAFENGYVKIG